MSNKYFLVFLLLIAVSCKTVEKPQARQHRIITTGASPGTCKIIGKIISINKPTGSNPNDICSRFPCTAQVLIVDIPACGSGISAPLHPNDTLTMRFTFTLEKTDKVFPDMKASYPGLKPGDTFIGVAQQHVAMGTDGVFAVGDYELQ